MDTVICIKMKAEEDLPINIKILTEGGRLRVAILMEILPQYIYPVGSWQIREAAGVCIVKRPSA
jgi:hypothetical protein